VTEILPPSKKRVIGFRPQLTLNLHGGTRSATLTGLSLAPLRAGFGHFRQSWVYNVKIPRAQQILGEERTVHTAEHVASAMFYLGVPRVDIPRACLFASRPEPGAYAVVHPLASAPEKAWPADRFAVAGRALRESGLEPVFIGGAGEDLSAFAEFRVLAGAPLSEVKTLLAGASLFVGNDSGPAHMAAAFGVPVVVLYGTSDPVIWAPWRTENVVLAAPEGLSTISVDRVLAAVDRLRGVAR
jgi:ADP-heptose:LPS heptosyltransferase